MYDVILFTGVAEPVIINKSIGAYKCAEILRQSGYTCLVVDHFEAFSREELLAVVDRYVSDRTLYVGFSTTFMLDTTAPPEANGHITYGLLTPNVTFFPHGKDVENEIVSFIKDRNSRCKIVLGGTKANQNISNSNVDYSIIGYAEGVIVNLTAHLRSGEPLLNSHRNIFGVVVIDDRLGKQYDFVNSTMHWSEQDVGGARVIPLEISRGCIFRCKFCSFALNGKQNLDFIRDMELLYAELMYNYENFSITDYTILDDTFNDSETKLDMLLSVTKRLPFQPRFWAYARLDLIARKPETIEKLYDIGLRAAFFGIETLNRKTGLIIGKGYDRSKQIAAIETIRHKYGDEIMLHGSFIVGLPGESAESVETTAATLLSNDIPLHSYGWNPLGIYPENLAFSSEIERNHVTYGYTKIDDTLVGGSMNWKNEFLTRTVAGEMSQRYNRQAQSSGRLYIHSSLGFNMKNLGYSEEYIRNTKFNEVDWSDQMNRRSAFLTAYKQRLLG